MAGSIEFGDRALRFCVCSVKQEMYPWREGPGQSHRSAPSFPKLPAQLPEVSILPHALRTVVNTRFECALVLNVLLFTVSQINVLTADVPRAAVKPDGVLVSAADHKVIEAQIHATRIFSVQSLSLIHI